MSNTAASTGTDLTLMELMRRFSTEEAARAYIEEMRWPNGPYCPHCGNADAARIYKVTPNPEKKIRAGLYKCAECRQGFTCTVNTIMEDSHIPLHKWLIAFYMMMASKTQISALQLQRHLELGSYRSAWFMCHRIRYALTETPGPDNKLKGTVEVDETWVGGLAKNAHGTRVPPKTAVVALVEREGNVRTQIVPSVTKETIGLLLRKNVEKTAVVNTDESNVYPEAASYYAGHDTVNHSEDEYSRNDKKTGRRASTNRVEGFFSQAKRSIDGTHHSVEPEYLPLYLNELTFKYNARKASDGARTVAAVGKIEGKRLTLRPVKAKKSDGQSA